MDNYTELQKKIEEAIQNQIPENPDRKWLDFYFRDTFLDVSPYMIKTLSEPCRELVNRGGKRWRPMLMVLTEKAFNGTEDSINLAPALAPSIWYRHRNKFRLLALFSRRKCP